MVVSGAYPDTTFVCLIKFLLNNRIRIEKGN